MTEPTTPSALTPAEPRLVEFGPRRIVGTRYAGKNENREIPAMWEREFLPRMGEIEGPAGLHEAFGICRCLPGASDGSFEYIAGAPAREGARLPKGMVEASIPQGRYLVFSVKTLAELSTVWSSAGQWLGAHPEFKTYCGPDGCECAEHPGFEYYPAEFDGQGPLALYFPIRP